MILTDEEKDRFCAYLEQVIESSRGIATQMEKLSLPATLISREKILASAALVILNDLRSAEKMTIG